jgi:ABC-type amino acid transport substrate-binding protein
MENISFRDIPGITYEEIRTIEELQKQNPSFAFGATLSTESFLTEDGEVGGFIALLCEWLTLMFDIPFKPEIFVFSDLLAKLTAEELDFGIMRDSEERRKIYFLSDPIGQRMIRMMRIEDSQPIDRIRQIRPPRYAFLADSTTFDMVYEALESGSYEALFALDYEIGYQMLSSGYADAFLEAGIAEASFDHHDDVIAEDFFPLLFNTVVMASANPDLAPVISIVTKALQHGGIHYLTQLYTRGYDEYLANKLWGRLNETERHYIQNNPVVKMGAQHYNYPIDFYNTHEGEWQGIIFDILNEVSALTGLSFMVATDLDTGWSELLQILEAGEVSFIPQLSRTPAR